MPYATEAGDTPTIGAMPVPESATVWVGLRGSLLAIASDADRPPRAPGLNVTLIVQEPPVATVVQVFAETAKSAAFAPVIDGAATVSGRSPVFETVTVCAALVVFTSWLAYVSDAGEMLATGAMPVPESATVRVGFTGSLLAIASDAVLLPRAPGLNVTLIAQVVLVAGATGAASVGPQVFAEIAKSAAFAPVTVMPLMASAALPLLDKVTVCAPLVVFTSWFP